LIWYDLLYMPKISRAEFEKLFVDEACEDLLKVIAPEVFIALLGVVNNQPDSMKRQLPSYRRSYYNKGSSVLLAGDHLGLSCE